MTRPRNSELAALGIDGRAGATFETDMLDVRAQRHEVVALLPDGVIVKRSPWGGGQRPAAAGGDR